MDGELSETATTEDFPAVQQEGGSSTAVLRDYVLRGYVMDKKRMENGAFLDEDYF